MSLLQQSREHASSLERERSQKRLPKKLLNKPLLRASHNSSNTISETSNFSSVDENPKHSKASSKNHENLSMKESGRRQIKVPVHMTKASERRIRVAPSFKGMNTVLQ
jgi:hypothetical protein